MPPTTWRCGCGSRAAVTLGEGDDLYSSWVTDRPGGFAEAEIGAIRELEPLAAFVFAGALDTITAGSLLATYLGADAAARVLGGAIERGRAETVEAVIWYSDLEGFTRLPTGRRRRQLQLRRPAEILGLLNDYAEILVDAIEAHGGQVLKFMGDGILATFRRPDGARLRGGARGLATPSARCAGSPGAASAVTRPYLALHAGEVLYGNIGGRAGSTSRCWGPRSTRRRGSPPCAASSTAGGPVRGLRRGPAGRRGSLVGLGRYALRGVARPQTLFTLDPDAC